MGKVPALAWGIPWSALVFGGMEEEVASPGEVEIVPVPCRAVAVAETVAPSRAVADSVRRADASRERNELWLLHCHLSHWSEPDPILRQCPTGRRLHA
ncbi:MAG: hypothetical protein NVS2B16_07450 [Chloroflexota bacterium]